MTFPPDAESRLEQLAARAVTRQRVEEATRKSREELSRALKNVSRSQREKLRRAVLTARDHDHAVLLSETVCSRPAWKASRVGESVLRIIKDPKSVPDIETLRAVVHELVEHTRSLEAKDDLRRVRQKSGAS